MAPTESDDKTHQDLWTPLSPDDELWAPPPKLAQPLADPAPALLNTHEMEWEAFERLILRMARQLDSARDIRLYGRRGQAQHGIDLVGFFGDRGATIYQAKKVKEFTAASLERAVLRYQGGRRPFNADRIVVAVASEARDKAVVEKLAQLREKYHGIDIDLWDRSEISEKLRAEPEIVATFFGVGTAEAFCGAQASMSLARSGPVPADAILRGPIAHLGLKEQLRQAEDTIDRRPEEAAEMFATIASRLEASPFVGHAEFIREKHAKALTAAGKAPESALVHIALGWRLLEGGDPFGAQRQVDAIVQAGGDLPDPIVRAVNFLSFASAFRRDYAVTIDELAQSFDDLQNSDPHCPEAAVMLAEESIAARRPDLLETRRRLLEAIAIEQSQTDLGAWIAARILVCLADCGDAWDALSSGARKTYPPRVTAWIFARHARHLALTSRPELSIDRWQDAIERACSERQYGDAADWVYCLRAVRMQYGFIEDGLDDYHRLARAIRAAGAGTLYPETYPARERGLAYLRDAKWPDALEALRRYLWRATTAADWVAELDAHERLGELFSNTGRFHEAVRHFVFSGHTKKLEALASGAPERPLRIEVALLSQAPWERVAAYTFVASSADLLTDENGMHWAALALREILGTANEQVKMFAANPFIAAFKAFAALTPLIDERGAQEFLRFANGLIRRKPKTYRFTDESQVRALIGIAEHHENLRSKALDQLLHALLVDESMARIAVGAGNKLLRSNTALVQKRLEEPASKGHLFAALGLITANGDTACVVDLARERLKEMVKPRAHESGVYEIGTGAGLTSVLVLTLEKEEQHSFCQAMITMASDQNEAAPNRHQALLALTNVARRLPDELCRELFEEALRFAKGEHDPDTTQGLFPGSTDPLSRFRVDLGPTSLRIAGLQAAASFSRARQDYRAVEEEAKLVLRNADITMSNGIASALSLIPVEEITLDIEFLATHPIEWLRALAAVVWAKRTDLDGVLGQRLAQDSSRHVRLALATSLNESLRHEAARTLLAGDPRRSVRAAVSSG